MNLPQQRMEVIGSRPPSALAALAEAWRSRHLAALFVQREVRLRYKQTLLGVAWAFLQPLATALVFALVFGLWVRVPTGGVSYFEFAFLGVSAWFFFAGAVQHATHSLLVNHSLVTKAYFPRAVLPAASVGLGLADFAVTLLFLVPVLAWHGTGVHSRMLWAPVALLLLVLLALGVALATSALSVHYRDFPNLVPLSLQLLMFASPVLYPMAIVPAAFQSWLMLNPLVGILELLRWAVFGVGEFPGVALAVALPVCVAVLVAGWLVFCRLERHFADEI
jgi:lipopolysaccharide transport system permease protein